MPTINSIYLSSICIRLAKRAKLIYVRKEEERKQSFVFFASNIYSSSNSSKKKCCGLLVSSVNHAGCLYFTYKYESFRFFFCTRFQKRIHNKHIENVLIFQQLLYFQKVQIDICQLQSTWPYKHIVPFAKTINFCRFSLFSFVFRNNLFFLEFVFKR